MVGAFIPARSAARLTIATVLHNEWGPSLRRFRHGAYAVAAEDPLRRV
jgi:hypothetical protein